MSAEDEDDMFGTSCLDCGEAIDESRPYGPTAEGDLMHLDCGDPDEPQDGAS